MSSKTQGGDYDPWNDCTFVNTAIRWKERTTLQKVKRVLFHYIGKPVALIVLLYAFICSLSLLSSAFRLVGGKAAGKAFAESDLLKNPVAGLMIGVLVTVLVQSSSTSTSIIISMVGGGVLHVTEAVYIIMGANIGTTVTNTIVSLSQVGNQNEFRRAFGAATVHDMFNWLTVFILLPLEFITGYLFKLSDAIVSSTDLGQKSLNQEFLSVLTKPLTKMIVKIDKNVIKEIALNKSSAYEKQILKTWCGYEVINGTNTPVERCEALFSLWDLSDSTAGVLLLFIALVVLCICLYCIVKLLNSLLQGNINVVIRKVLNCKLPGKFGWVTGYISILAGAIMTILVQSSSIFTSALTPLVGMGLIQIERMYPLTLGSNIGTCITGILAAFSSSGDMVKNTVQLSMCHLFFNISGILIWYPIPFMRKIPIKAAKCLGNTTAKYKWFAFMYLILMFFVFPAAIFGLSYANIYLMLAVIILIVSLMVIISVINLLQTKKPNFLPPILRSWEFLPLWMRSLKPVDDVIKKTGKALKCCKKTSGSEICVTSPVMNANGSIESSAKNTHENLAFTMHL